MCSRRWLAGPRSDAELARVAGHTALEIALLCRWLAWRGLLRADDRGWALTDEGRSVGVRVARNHRLWAAYLVRYAAIAPDQRRSQRRGHRARARHRTS
jgi:Mn-dependent DtxR family transcriptional regulator